MHYILQPSSISFSSGGCGAQTFTFIWSPFSSLNTGEPFPWAVTLLAHLPAWFRTCLPLLSQLSPTTLWILCPRDFRLVSHSSLLVSHLSPSTLWMLWVIYKQTVWGQRWYNSFQSIPFSGEFVAHISRYTSVGFGFVIILFHLFSFQFLSCRIFV